MNREKPRPAKIDAAILLNDKKTLSDAGTLGAMKANESKKAKKEAKEALAEVEAAHKQEKAAVEEWNDKVQAGEDVLPHDPDDQKEE